MISSTWSPPLRSGALRIAVVCETYPPEVNGVARTAARFVQGLRDRGHDVQLIRPRQVGDEPTDRVGMGADILTPGLPIPGYPELKIGLPRARRVRNLWRDRRPDLVHIVTEGPLGWSALRAARQLDLPVASDYRTNFQAYSRHYGIGWLHGPIRAYLRYFHNRTDATLVPTRAVRDNLAAIGYDNLHVIARGVDTELFSPARRDPALRRSWGARPDTPVVLYVGRLAAEKNLPLAIAAFDRMRVFRPHARLVLVGNGPLAAQVQALCPDAICAGTRHGEELATYYASADIFLFPSLTETFGNVTLEAMASGLGVVAFNDAAAAELITDGKDGLLADVNRPESFTRLAVELIGSPVRYQRYGKHARQRSLTLTWRQVVLAQEALFTSLAVRSDPLGVTWRFERPAPEPVRDRLGA